MSQEDTYRPAVLPSEAVMMPAMEENPDAPPPAAQEVALENDPAMMVPAYSRGASHSLERLRNRMRGLIPEGTEWVSTAQRPLDRATIVPEQRPVAAGRMLEPSETPLTRTFTQGAALATLMRSATRQHAPAPRLTQSQAMSRSGAVPVAGQVGSQAQMRGALRGVVRNAQQPQSFSDIRPVSLNQPR